MSDLNKVKELRRATGAGFKDCNNALKEANGDIEKSIEILRIKGITKASKKMSRVANEGLVSMIENEKHTSMIEINCETDFVAKNQDFIEFVKELSVINNNVSSDLTKLNKTTMANSKTVEENLLNLISKIGEKIIIGRAVTFEKGNYQNFTYQHTIITENLSKLGVIVSLIADENNDKLQLFGKQLSMHIAASNPLAIDHKSINEDIITKENNIISEELANSGKPKEIIEKISLGRLNKFKMENSLLSQAWVMDPKKTVSEIISSLGIKGLKIINFSRIKIGE
tara:strand:- start:765 stop:1616 length:852 start_codon:yes stop_codon:yes gene_type:complete